MLDEDVIYLIPVNISSIFQRLTNDGTPHRYIGDLIYVKTNKGVVKLKFIKQTKVFNTISVQSLNNSAVTNDKTKIIIEKNKQNCKEESRI